MANDSPSNTTIDDLIDSLDLPIKDAPLILDEESVNKLPVEEKEEVVDKNIILNNALNSEDSYVTYHIHIVKEDETLDTIASNEHISKEIICDCNDTSTITAGMKLIIPSSSDE